MMLLERIKSWRRPSTLPAVSSPPLSLSRLERALRQRALLDTLLFNPLLRSEAAKSSAASGERSVNAPKPRSGALSRMLSLGALPLRLLGRCSPRLREWRVRRLRSLVLSLLCSGLRAHSARSSRNSSR